MEIAVALLWQAVGPEPRWPGLGRLFPGAVGGRVAPVLVHRMLRDALGPGERDGAMVALRGPTRKGEFLEDHPTTDNRIAALRWAAAEMGLLTMALEVETL